MGWRSVRRDPRYFTECCVWCVCTGVCVFVSLYHTYLVTFVSRGKSYVSEPWQADVPALCVRGVQCSLCCEVKDAAQGS